MTSSPDLDKYLERLVEAGDTFPSVAVTNGFDPDSARAALASYTDIIRTICAVLREKRKRERKRSNRGKLCEKCECFYIPCECE